MFTLSPAVKLPIAIVFFLLPLAMLAYFFYQEKQVMVIFSEQELAGVRHMQASHAALAALLQENGQQGSLANTYDEVKAETAQLNVADAVDAVVAAPASDGKLVLAQKLQAAISLAADKSNITLDPDADAYFIGDASTNQLPGMMVQAESVATAAATRLQHGSDAVAQEAFVIARNLLNNHASALQADYGKAFANNADGSVKASLAEKSKEAEAALGAFMQAIEGQDTAAIASSKTSLLQSLAGLLKQITPK